MKYIFRKRHEYGYVYFFRSVISFLSDLWDMIEPFALGALAGAILALFFYYGIVDEKDDWHDTGGSFEKRIASPN